MTHFGQSSVIEQKASHLTNTLAFKGLTANSAGPVAWERNLNPYPSLTAWLTVVIRCTNRFSFIFANRLHYWQTSPDFANLSHENTLFRSMEKHLLSILLNKPHLLSLFIMFLHFYRQSKTCQTWIAAFCVSLKFYGRRTTILNHIKYAEGMLILLPSPWLFATFL